MVFCVLRRLPIRRIKQHPFRKFCSENKESVIVKKRSNITCIGINRPETKNCLNLEVVRELSKALDDFEHDSKSNVAVIYGEKGNFCYGLDTVDVSKDPLLTRKVELLPFFDRFVKKPVVAAVNGYAVGIGFDLALWCDFRIVEETAVMGWYARQYGAPLTNRSAEKIYTLVGLSRALDWVLTGRVVKAKEAYESGIANRLVACGTALGQAINFACALSNMPQPSLKANRATLYNLGNKYPREVKEMIYEEQQEMYNIAIKDLKDGIHITKSGDVRNREAEPKQSWW